MSREFVNQFGTAEGVDRSVKPDSRANLEIYRRWDAETESKVLFDVSYTLWVNDEAMACV
jgi:hypothetical protein